MLQYNYDNLQRSLIDVIKEEQAKLDITERISAYTIRLVH